VNSDTKRREEVKMKKIIVALTSLFLCGNAFGDGSDQDSDIIGALAADSHVLSQKEVLGYLEAHVGSGFEAEITVFNCKEVPNHWPFADPVYGCYLKDADGLIILRPIDEKSQVQVFYIGVHAQKVLGVVNGWIVDRKANVLTMTPVMTISDTPGYDFSAGFHPKLDTEGRFAFWH
jgi:hypothetical protein